MFPFFFRNSPPCLLFPSFPRIFLAAGSLRKHPRSVGGSTTLNLVGGTMSHAADLLFPGKSSCKRDNRWQLPARDPAPLAHNLSDSSAVHDETRRWTCAPLESLPIFLPSLCRARNRRARGNLRQSKIKFPSKYVALLYYGANRGCARSK